MTQDTSWRAAMGIATPAHRLPSWALASLLTLSCGGLDACGQDTADQEGVGGDVVLDAVADGSVVATDGVALDAVQADAGPTPGCAIDGMACDDGDPCTFGDVCKAGACSSGTDLCACREAADCPTANPCAGPVICDQAALPWSCRQLTNQAVVCSAAKDSWCSANTCDPNTGECAMEARNQGAPCASGDVCLQATVCDEGACAGGKNVCPCASDSDCAQKDGTDQCAGKHICDVTVFPAKCVINPASVVNCASGKDTACSVNSCDPKTGACAMSAVAGTPPCDDGDPCTNGDACSGGTCVSGATNSCTCKNDADCVAQDDGNLCNGLQFCDQGDGACKANPASVVSCPSVNDTTCLKNVCYPTAGVCQATAVEKAVHGCDQDKKNCHWVLLPGAATAAKAVPCDDGKACSSDDICAGGACKGGTDTCGCTKNSDCVAFDDGDLCNGQMYCNQATNQCVLNPASVVNCPSVDNTDCQKNACTPKTGNCAPTPLEKVKKICDVVGQQATCGWRTIGPAELPAAASLCDDGSACTQGEMCEDGACVGGTNVCECWKDGDCAAKEDGNACNGTLFCDKSGAKPKCTVNPASIVVCNKSYPGPCVGDLCNPASGECAQGPVNNGLPCDDGTLCTIADACLGGKCVGKAANCDDGDACTNDSCQPAKGCLHAPPVCDDANDCTHDGCDSQTGKCFADPSLKNGQLCNADNNGCTVNDACAWGVCKMGAQIVCDLPLKVCQQALCVPDTATKYHCLVNAAADGADCDDGVACTVGSSCLKGKCSGAGKERFFAKTYAPPLENGSLRAVSVHKDGDLMAVGGTWQGAGNAAKDHAWWILRTDPAGGQQWSKVLKGSVGEARQVAGAVAIIGESDSLVGGGLWNQVGGADFHLARYTESGEQVWSKTLTLAKSHEAIGALLVDKYGGITAAGERTEDGRTGVRVVQLSAIGLPVWALNHHDSGQDHFLGELLRRADGSLLLVGTRKNPATGQEHGLLLPISVAGQPGAPRLLGDGKTHALRAAASLPDGELMVAGRQCPAASFCSWFVGLDAKLNIRWQSLPQSGVQVTGLAAMGKGRIGTAAWTQPAGAKATMIGRGLDRWSNTQWQRNLAAGSGSKAHAVADGGGDIVLVGEVVDGKQKGRIARLDAFGHTSCADAGACLNKIAGDCDDGKDCTVDWCDTKAGCKHAVVEKLLCDTQDTCSEISTCGSGSCKPTASGRLWYFSEPYGDGAGNHVHGGTTLTSDGGYAQTGQAVVSGAHRAFVRRLDGSGKLLWSKPVVYGGTGHGASLIATDKGAVIALVRLAPTSGGVLGALQRLEADGKVGWTRADAWLKTYLPWGLIVGDSGSFYVIATQNTYHGGTVYLRRLAANGGVISQSAGSNLGYHTQSTPYIPNATPQNATNGALLWGPRGVRHPDGGISVAVTRKTHLTGNNAPKQRGWIGHWNGAGAVSWTWGTAHSTYYTYSLVDVEDRAAGGVIAGGARVGGNLASGWLFALDKNGKVQWEKLWAGLGYGIDAVAELPGGHIAAGGWKMAGGKQVMWMAQFTPAGTTAWQRTWNDATGFVHEIEPLPDGDLMIGFAAGMNWRATVGRADAWGTAACDQAGKCVKVKTGDCDDKNPCTADWCLAASGCQHTALPGCK